ERRARDVVEVSRPLRIGIRRRRREQRVLAQYAAREDARDTQLVIDNRDRHAHEHDSENDHEVADQPFRRRKPLQPLLEPAARLVAARAEMLVVPVLYPLPEPDATRLLELEPGEPVVERGRTRG